ncbi:hypothetical protein ABZ467_04840 [Streptomyces sp. NPDC005727]|uniref:hypothetical protein n=1 Tax=Streptomyces sp. NPDC005727 TaxID=3157053 RepID=UPI0033F6496E
MTDAQDFLTATRAFYDTTAADHAGHFQDSLADRPLDRALLAAYAETIPAGGTVADLGCGPGLDTGYHLAHGARTGGAPLGESVSQALPPARKSAQVTTHGRG